jgi:magnesium-transporting ATPase (P-type)
VAGLAVVFHALARGEVLETARTLVVNTIVVPEIFYLFNVRYLHMRSLAWRGLLGTRAVLIGISVTLHAQALFTYAPLMQKLFATRSVSVPDAMLIAALGIVLFGILEGEKMLLHR